MAWFRVPLSPPLIKEVDRTNIEVLGFSLSDLHKAVDEGRVRSQTHPEFPELSIFNYTEDTAYKADWDDITLWCRGLILNTDTHEIVARPFKKFFNYGQVGCDIIEMTDSVEVTDKLDGSLGILYRTPDGGWAIATRGSFASDQALHATEVLSKYPKYFWDGAMTGSYTYLFEIIFPDNRIVVNYGDLDDLVLLGAVHKAYGRYLSPNTASAFLSWDGPVTEVFNAQTFAEALSLPDRAGKEGYIVRSGNKIVKFKQQDYVALHRIVTNLNPKTIWEMRGQGKTVDDICKDIPDEFYDYVKDVSDRLDAEYLALYEGALTALAKILREGFGNDHAIDAARADRKKFAELATKSEYSKYLFLILDGRSIREVVWQHIKPRGDTK